MTAAAGSNSFGSASAILEGESSAPTPMSGKTLEAGEPSSEFVPGALYWPGGPGYDPDYDSNWDIYQSVWWKYVATATGKIKFDTHASTPGASDDPDNMIWIYDGGPSLAELTLIWMNDYDDIVNPVDYNTAGALVQVEEGRTYWIRVTSYSDPDDSITVLTAGPLAPGIPAAYLRFAGGLSHEIPPAELVLTPLAPLYTRYTPRTVRWRFRDPSNGDVWDFTINPDQMTSPTKEKNVRHTLGVGTEYGRFATVQAAPRPREWTFSGVIRSKQQHDILESWYERTGVLHVTDHLSRTFEVMLQGFEVSERKPTKAVTWRLRYTMKTLLLRQLS